MAGAHSHPVAKNDNQAHKLAAPTQQKSQRLSQLQAVDFVDARPELLAQRVAQTQADLSPRHQALQEIKALQNSSPRTAPLLSATSKNWRNAPLTMKVGQPLSTETSSDHGLPAQLRAGIESLSGLSMNHVKVHYNSAKPAQLNAHAFAQGNEIHLASGQEHHLPHEAWHVVQQAQGRVRPTMQMKGEVAINDEVHLETEADIMGARANAIGPASLQRVEKNSTPHFPAQLQTNNTCAQPSLTCMPVQRSSSQVVQRAITRRMYNLVMESETLEELQNAIWAANYGDQIRYEMIALWEKENNPVMADQIPDVEITENEQDESATDGGTSIAEFVLNNDGHQGDVFDRDIGKDSYFESANVDQSAIQLKRTGGAMTGPKDYGTQFGDFHNAFYILGGDGSVDFSEQPTTTRHAAYTPVGKLKKLPLKAKPIAWANPDLGGSKINLNKHPNIGNLRKDDRPQHFGMADAIYAKLKGWSTASKAAEFRSGKWTWHHLPNKYEMILVDMNAHAQHGHNGGVFLW